MVARIFNADEGSAALRIRLGVISFPFQAVWILQAKSAASIIRLEVNSVNS